MFPHTIQDLIQSSRRKNGMSRAQLATRAGIALHRLQYLERTAGAAPRPHESAMIAEVLGISDQDWQEAAFRTALVAEQARIAGGAE